MPLVLGVLVAVLILYYFASRGDSGPGDTADAENELLHLCLGDRKQAERLLALEEKKSPGITRGEAVLRAIHYLRRDVR